MASLLQSPAYAGLHAAVIASTFEDPEAAAFDAVSAQETVPNISCDSVEKGSADLEKEVTEESDEDDSMVCDDAQWRKAVSDASKGITDKTEGEYER